MSNTPIQDPAAQGLSSGSGQTLTSRPLQPISDPSASKRVCFYKSGDNKFSGHRMVINGRTFKTFDALLDALSKKVPLPFGVRTITTPRGTHLVKGLDDLHDGGSYVCSDQKRVKPLNLDEVNRRQVPWNTTRPLSTGRRRRQGLQSGQFGRKNEVANRPAKVIKRVAVRTPKRLVVIKNRDPTVKRTIVLQKRTAPTFDALLDYLSQILQFPVLKLYSTDGRRVDGLAALILCAGVVVAAGNEPFRLGNYNFHRTGQMTQAMYMETVEPSMLQPRAQRYIVNQINKSRNGSMNNHLHHNNGSFETEVNQHHTSMETCGTGMADNEDHTCIVPQDDDIEKSFRVNQDGSMTVEMKVRLTIKEEEMLHWTTTLSRSSLSKRPACASISESGNSSPDSNNAFAKDSSSVSEDETKEENHPTGARKGVGFNNEQVYGGYTSTVLGKAKTSFKRTPTPGPRHIKKRASVESVKMVTESGVQESTLGHYSYMERTADAETTEEYCIVRHTSSSNRPIPKPRKTASAGASHKGSNSSIKSSGVAEVLQIQNNGMEITETVMHICESQGCYDNYLANEEYSADSVPLHGSTPAVDSKPSTVSGPRSSSNDIDFSWQPPTADSQQRQKEEILSLSSEPISPTTNNLSSVTEKDIATNSKTEETVKKVKTPQSEKNKKCIRRASDTNVTSNLEKSNSVPDFSTQVASVFGSSCKAFLSFLSVMTLRDSLTGSALGDEYQSRSTSEAMLMMESLQKISTIEDEEEQRASLTDLQSRASSQFRERWKDFQLLRERLESEPFSPKVSETEFALDVVSEGGDVFEDQQLGIDELMEELNMPQDLRAEISSTIQQARSFYPVEESTFVETERNQSDSEDDVEKFVDERDDETKQSMDPDTTCIVEDITEQPMYSEQAKMISELEQEPDEVQETCLDVKDSEVSQTERDEALNFSMKENGTEEKEDEDQVEEVEDDREGEKVREEREKTEIYDDGEELENIEKEREKEAEVASVKEDEGQDDWEAEKGSREESVEKVEEGTEGEMTDYEEEGEELERGEKEVVEETEGIMDGQGQEAREDDSVEETDEREGVEETEEEERGKDEVEEEGDKEEKGEEDSKEENQVEESEVEADKVAVESDENISEEQEGEEKAELVSEKNVEEEVEEVIEETEEEEEATNNTDKVEEREEEEMDVVTKRDVEEEAEEGNEGTDEGEETDNVTEEVDKEEEEEEMDVVIEERDEEEDKMVVVNEEEVDDDDAEVENTEERRARVITDEEEEEEETDKDTGEEEKCDEGNRKELEETEDSLEEESVEAKEVVEESETEENMEAGQTLAEEEREEDEENELNEALDQVEKQESKDEVEEGKAGESECHLQLSVGLGDAP
ncbi:oxygen-regulated protein 1-like protein [Lates japonicus]|uniref:Oxygen-regulated protein 1-like protein n=1 Tax=Lates japonicus TaxID=270547 RepID=A0AAD3R0V7_LATJO|nr:oxygen-regulated protein 1-like protein [Lates japonicus]